jgi:hypothetical protein
MGNPEASESQMGKKGNQGSFLIKNNERQDLFVSEFND